MDGRGAMTSNKETIPPKARAVGLVAQEGDNKAKKGIDI